MKIKLGELRQVIREALIEARKTVKRPGGATNTSAACRHCRKPLRTDGSCAHDRNCPEYGRDPIDPVHDETPKRDRDDWLD